MKCLLNTLLFIVLFPFSLLYLLVVSFRNLMFRFSLLTFARFKLPVICVGNITVGGTGKTPFTEYLIALLKDKHSIATLSRGYLRKSEGFQLAEASSEVKDVGDEALQIHRKFPDITVAVDKDRVHGIETLIQLKNPDIILLDDAFQHRYVKAGLTFVLVDYNRPVFKDFVMPSGRLREPLCSLRRADIVVVTKAPSNLSREQQKTFADKLSLDPGQLLFFTYLAYKDSLFPLNGGSTIQLDDSTKKLKALLITGIANPAPFTAYLEPFFNEINHLRFPDHHAFTQQDIKKIQNLRSQTGTEIIVTTEKDAVRLKELLPVMPPGLVERIYYLPVSIDFHQQDKQSFEERVKGYVDGFFEK